MKEFDLADLDYESLFIEYRQEVVRDKATSFMFNMFVYWIKNQRKYFKGYYKVKGSDHGQKFGSEAIDNLADKIISVWEEVGLIEVSDNQYNKARNKISRNCFDITEFGMLL